MTIPKMMKKSGEEITRLRVFAVLQALSSLFVMMLCKLCRIGADGANGDGSFL